MSVTPSLFSQPDPARIRNQGGLLNLFYRLRLLTRNRKRYCFASNASLAATLGVSVDTITRWINRLVALGAIGVEQVVGVERRIRVLLSPEVLKARIFPGDRANWRKTEKASSYFATTPTPSSFCPPVAEGVADTLAEGQYRELRSSSLQTLPKEEGQQAGRGSESPAAASCLSTLSEPLTPAVGESAARQLATLAQRLKRSPEQVRQIVAAYQARRVAGQAIHNPGGYLRRLIEADPASVGLPVAPASHPSEIRATETVRRVVVREEQLLSATLRPAPTAPLRAPERTSGGLAPASDALATLRAKIGKRGRS